MCLALLGAVEVIYLCQLLMDMGFESKSPTPVHEDNPACIEWTNNVIGGRERAKHIDIPKHFVYEAALLGHLHLNECLQLISLPMCSPRVSSRNSMLLHSLSVFLVFSGVRGRTRKRRRSSRGET